MSLLYSFAIFFFLFLCFVLCFAVMIQEGKGGLGASFGGDSGDSLFGTATPEVLKKFTAYLAVTFVGMCVLLSFWTASLSRQQSDSLAPTELTQ